MNLPQNRENTLIFEIISPGKNKKVANKYGELS